MLTLNEVLAIRRVSDCGDVHQLSDLDIGALCDSHEALRTQVSALRQQIETLEAGRPTLYTNDQLRQALVASADEAEAARQEAETQQAMLKSAIAQLATAQREAETLRGQLDAAQKERNALERELAVILPGSTHADRAAARVAAPREPK